MKRLLQVFIICICTVGISPVFANQPASVTVSLKPRQPNWRAEIAEIYPQGSPKTVVYYEPTLSGEIPVKQVFFYESGGIQSEMDIVLVSEDSAASKEWKSTLVPHGSRVDLSEKGGLIQVSNYDQGLLNGEFKIFYSDGKLQTFVSFKQGLLHGPAHAYYENGQLREEALYVDGAVDGELIRYYENGIKAALFPHKEGKVHGMVNEWYPSGSIKSQKQFAAGILHSTGRNPAVILYDENRNVSEVVDFREGKIVGTHIVYYPNGKEAHRIPYKNGKRDGKEQFFAEDGILLGEGQFTDGIPVGKHWRNHADGGVAYLGEFDLNGILQKPVCEWDENGQKIREYFIANEKTEGPCTEWFANGNLKFEHNYANGQYEGEQKEYYPTGQIKVLTHYQDHLREGLHEEWHENGVLSRRCQFVKGMKDGQIGEWYSNGNPKLDAYFIMDKPDGIQSEWYENGQLKFRVEFAMNLKQGWQREWNEKGELIAEAFYENDLFQGPVLSWWNQDQLKTRFLFEKGKKIGQHRWFYEDGQLSKVAGYKDDQLDGELKSWFSDGSLQSSQSYRNGKPIGVHFEYFPKADPSQKNEERICRVFNYDDAGQLDGEQKTYFPKNKIQAIAGYSHGQLNGLKQLWDEQGALVEEATYVLGKMEGRYFQHLDDLREIVFHYHNNLKNGLHEIYYPPNPKGTQVKAVVANYEDELVHGVVVEWNENGVKIAETPYVHGAREGVARVYDSDGKLSATVTFTANQNNGLTTQYFADGSIFREVFYVDGKREGEEKTFYNNGNLASICNYKDDLLDGLSQSWTLDQVLAFEAEYLEGMRHGKFNKYYEDGKPYIEQTFVYDKLDGEKRKYERDGDLMVTYYREGELVESTR